jgi:hypothetical protein
MEAKKLAGVAKKLSQAWHGLGLVGNRRHAL